MKICKIIGHVWATKKEHSLEGIKLMIVEPSEEYDGKKERFVAADLVGAGIGERVLVISGSSARFAFRQENCAVDAAIIGIVDALEVADA